MRCIFLACDRSDLERDGNCREMTFGHLDAADGRSISLSVKSGEVIPENVPPRSSQQPLVFPAPQCDITWPSSLPPTRSARRQRVLHGVILLASWARALSPSSQYLEGREERGLIPVQPAHSPRAGGQAHWHHALSLFSSRIHYLCVAKLQCAVI